MMTTDYPATEFKIIISTNYFPTKIINKKIQALCQVIFMLYLVIRININE